MKPLYGVSQPGRVAPASAKGIAATLFSLAGICWINAAPASPTVVAGQASFAQKGALTTIHAGNNSIINYRSFDILAHETVQFVQPDSRSRVLNRVSGDAPTSILGNLLANGQVYIANPAGIYFGAGSYINVGALFAAAGKIADHDFLDGVNRFTSLGGSVVNQGMIQADSITLAGQHVANSGHLNVNNGLVALLAGDEVLLGERGGRVFVNLGQARSAEATGVENTGTINAGSGRSILGAGDLYALAVVNSGAIQGHDITLEGQGSGSVRAAGRLDASARLPGGRGGTVQVLGEEVVLNGLSVDASGDAGGGSVLIGGDYQGKGGTRAASQTYVAPDVTINADAINSGNGGKVIIWSDDTTEFHGTISAQALGKTGAGGFAEISGKAHLALSGHAYLGGANGRNGQLLLDPGSVVIRTGTNPPTLRLDEFYDDWIVQQLETGHGDLTISTGNSQNGSDQTLTLEAKANIAYESANNFNLEGADSVLVDGSILNFGSGGVTFTSGGNIDFGAGALVRASSVTAHAGTDGTGDVIFRAGSEIMADRQSYRAGDGTRGTLGIAAIDCGTNAVFRNTIGEGSPNSFTYRQDAPIADEQIPHRAYFGATPPLNYTLESDDGAVTISTAGKVNGSRLTLRANSTLSIDVPLNLLSFQASGASILLNAEGVTTTGHQIYHGDVVLAATTPTTLNGAAISFDGTLRSVADGQNALVIEAATSSFGGAVGDNHYGLASLAIGPGGTTELNGGSVTTSGSQSYGGTLELGANTTLTGKTLEMANVTGHGWDLVLDFSDQTDLNGATVTGIRNLATGRGGTTLLQGNLATMGGQTYDDNVILRTDTTLSGINVTFKGRVNGTEAGNEALTVFGNTVFGDGPGDTVGQQIALEALRVSGSTALNGGLAGEETVTTTGTQTFDGPVILGADSVLESTGGGAIAFNSSVTGSRNLGVNTSGFTRFGGAVGTDVLPLNSLVTDAAGNTEVNAKIRAGSLTVNDPLMLAAPGTEADPSVTSGAQVYGGSMTLGADTTLTGTTLELADVVGQSRDLTLNFSGITDLNGATITGIGKLVTGNGGTTRLRGNLATTGGQTYEDDVTLGTDTTLTGTTVIFKGTVNGTTAGNQVLTVFGNTVFGDGLGDTVGQSIALEALRVSGSTAFNAASAGGKTVTTTGTQTYDGPVILGADSVLESTGGGAIAFNSSVNGSQNLVVNSTGTTRFADAVGTDVLPLTGLVTDAAGNTEVNAKIRAGSVTFNDPLILAAPGTEADPSVMTTTGFQRYDGAVVLDAPTVLQSTSDGPITFNSAVSGPQSLVVNTAGTTTFSGAVGTDGMPLAGLITDSGGDTEFSAKVRAHSITINDPVTLAAQGTDADPSVRTSGDQIYQGSSVRLGTAALTPESITLESTGGAILLDPQGTENHAAATIFKTSPGDLTIKAERFVMGQNEKLVHSGQDSTLAVPTPGNISVQASVGAVLSDIAALGDIVIASPNITLLQRAPVSGQTHDRGLDFVGRTISVGPAIPVFGGDPSADPIAVFGTTEGLANVAETDNIVRTRIDAPPPFTVTLDARNVPLDPQAPLPANISEALGLIAPVPIAEAAQVEVSPAFGSYEQVFSDLLIPVLELRNTLGVRNTEAAQLLDDIMASIEFLRNQHREWAAREELREHNPDAFLVSLRSLLRYVKILQDVLQDLLATRLLSYAKRDLDAKRTEIAVHGFTPEGKEAPRGVKIRTTYRNVAVPHVLVWYSFAGWYELRQSPLEKYYSQAENNFHNFHTETELEENEGQIHATATDPGPFAKGTYSFWGSKERERHRAFKGAQPNTIEIRGPEPASPRKVEISEELRNELSLDGSK